MVKVFVAISYGHGAVCVSYRQHFENSSNPRAKLFLQDGDPSQNPLKGKNSIFDIGARVFSITPRSPDINPIENLFHLVKKQLNRDALEQNITQKSYRQFFGRVKEAILNFPVATIDNIIKSMDKRMNMIIKKKGQRLRS